MRAAVVDRYGPPDVVRVVEVPDPRPGRGQVLVEVEAVAVTSGDARIRGARFPRGMAVPARLALGLTRPRRRVLGGSFSGRVVALGAGVHDVAVGDEVCGMNGARMGAHAELLAVDSRRVVAKPARVSHVEAAALLFGGTTAMHLVRGEDGVRAGDRVLVNGASGAIGTNAVQLAALAGAEVTGITRAANAPLVTGLGASATIDHTVVDLGALDERYDLVLDAVGTLTPRTGRALLRPGGTLALPAAGLVDTVLPRRQVVSGVSPERPETFAALLDLVAAGALRVVVQDVVDLDRIADAYRLVDSGRKVGNVVVRP